MSSEEPSQEFEECRSFRTLSAGGYSSINPSLTLESSFKTSAYGSLGSSVWLRSSWLALWQ